MNRLLAAVLFLFEPFLAANLLLRVGPSLFQRDLATLAGVCVRLGLALASIVAAMAVRDARPAATRLAAVTLAASASFAILQHFTRLLPTSLAPDVSLLFTSLILLHHAGWIALLALRGVR